jgi:hypothetical protein
MRLASLLLLALLLSYQTCAMEPGEIAAPSIKAPNMNMPKPIITSPNMHMPEPNNNPNQTVSTITDRNQVTKAIPNDLSGKWSIKFDDRPDRSLDLTLWSSGRTKIMGYGTLTKGGSGNSVTASGSFAEKELVLAVQSAELEYAKEKYDEYDLDLFVVNNTANNTLTGTYILTFGGEFVGDGNATAVKR